MAHLLFAIPYRHIVFKAVAGVFAVFLFFAIVTGTVPVACFATGGPFCPKGSVAPQANLAVAAVPEAPQAAAVVKVAANPEPTLSHNDVLAQTFSALKVQLAPAASASTTEVAAARDDSSGSLSSRKVQTVAIRADGQPDIAPQTTGRAELPRVDLEPDDPPATLAYADTVPSTRIKIAGADALSADQPTDTALAAADAQASSTPPAAEPEVKKPAPTATTKVASTGGTSATVKGSGANARTRPSKSADVAFALPGGSKVTILENTRGWLHVRDAKGRDGWMYKDYVTRG